MPARPAHHPLATVRDRGSHPHLPPRRIRRRRPVDPVDGRVRGADPDTPCAERTPTGEAVAGTDRCDRDRAVDSTDPTDPTASDGRPCVDLRSQDGSVATEYGLLAVVAATIVSVMLDWATSGGITSLLTAVMDRVGDLVGL